MPIDFCQTPKGVQVKKEWRRPPAIGDIDIITDTGTITVIPPEDQEKSIPVIIQKTIKQSLSVKIDYSDRYSTNEKTCSDFLSNDLE